MHYHSRIYPKNMVYRMKNFMKSFNIDSPEMLRGGQPPRRLHINPILFDVSLRDGLQTMSPELYPTSRKMELFKKIMAKSPAKIEIGSLISPKILPILSDSIEIHRNATQSAKIAGKNVDMYMLIPSVRKIEEALANNVNNMSFITSVSDEFQIKNVNKTLEMTKLEFQQIERLVPDYVNKKLYISCIHECPISGIISTHQIIREIMHYWSHYQFDELCLSDTCGTLTHDIFSKIVEELDYMGMDMSILSVHLHVSDEIETMRIIHKCIEKGINKFDVSILDGGGCSVTMNGKEESTRKKMHANLSYDLFERAVDLFINNNCPPHHEEMPFRHYP